MTIAGYTNLMPLDNDTTDICPAKYMYTVMDILNVYKFYVHLYYKLIMSKIPLEFNIIIL